MEFDGAPTSAPATDYLRRQGKSKGADAKRSGFYAELAKGLVGYGNKPLTLGDARLIQKDITELNRHVGYPLMAVVVPPQ